MRTQEKRDVIIGVAIDTSRAFVDANGSFYCGTTAQEKENTGTILQLADLTIYACDLHPITSRDHKINGGLYPAHHPPLPNSFASSFLYDIAPDGTYIQLGTKTMSPVMSEDIAAYIRDRFTGIIIPRGVYFQDGRKEPFCTPDDVEQTFGSHIIPEGQFLFGNYHHIIAPKQYFDATRLDGDHGLPDGDVVGIPSKNYNVFSLLEEKFPSHTYNKIFINTGVVEGICRIFTSAGERQMYPLERIINVSDATTPLIIPALGFSTPEESRDACKRIGQQIGIEYMSTEDVLNEFGNRKRIENFQELE